MPLPPPASKRAAASDSVLRGRLVTSQGMSPHPIDMTYGVLDAAKQTKSESVRSMGVGTNVLPCVFCFNDTGVVESYAILIENDSSRTLNIALLEAVAVMRRSWGCHAVVWAHESYTAPPSDEDVSRTLPYRPGGRGVHHPALRDDRRRCCLRGTALQGGRRPAHRMGRASSGRRVLDGA